MIRPSMLVFSWLATGCVEVDADKASTHSGDSVVDGGDTGREHDSAPPGHTGSESGEDTSGETGVETADTSDTWGEGEDSDSSVDSTLDSGDDTSTEPDTATPLTVDLSTDADAKLIGEAADDAYGPRIAVAGGGDVNGDGHSDLLVGMVGTGGPGERASGSTYLVHGPASGDLDLGDSDAELEGSDSEFSGTSVDLAGDVNGDGYADILIGAPYYSGPVGTDGTEGQAYVVLGPVTGEVELMDADAFLRGELFDLAGHLSASYTGCSVAIVGDTNGDGDADMLVGAYGYDAGAAYLVLGPVSGIFDLSEADLRVVTATGGGLGDSVSSAGDTNGDGLADIIMGQPSNTDASLLLFTGPASGDVTDGDADATFAASADYLAGGLGASAGDVNADGYDDVLMGIPTADDTGPYAGAAFLYLGPFTEDVALTDAQATLLGAIAYGSAGLAVDGAGDVDGDGYADFVVGAPEAFLAGPGTTWLFYGLVSGTVSLDEADVQIVGEGDDQAGWAVAGAGDVDADGLDDLLIGGPGDDDGGEGAGAAWLVLGASL